MCDASDKVLVSATSQTHHDIWRFSTVLLGSEQALAPVQESDTFAEGAWDKVPKTEGTFDHVLLNTTSHSYYKGWIDVLFICIRVLRTNFREKLPSQKILFSTKDVSHLKSHILEYHSIFVLAISKFCSHQQNIHGIDFPMFNQPFMLKK